jgi:Protein of unknown function (DUF2393)
MAGTEPSTRPGSSSSGFLAQHQPGGERRNWLPWVVAGCVVLLVLGWMIFAGRQERTRQAAETALATPDAYASQLTLDHLQMSQAPNFAGGKITYIDGQVTNRGGKTVTGVQVAVTFKNDIGEPPQRVPIPLSLIRTREPYVDIEPVAAEPLKPGEMWEFRLIFDHITPNWNQQYPEIAATRVQTR